jgi:hypothetical protein
VRDEAIEKGSGILPRADTGKRSVLAAHAVPADQRDERQKPGLARRQRESRPEL